VGCDHGLGRYSGYRHGCCFSDGSASVYLSSGGGFIGGSSHETIRKATQKMVAIAADCQPNATATTTYPLPRHAQVIFYFLTDAGVFTANAPQEELSSHRRSSVTQVRTSSINTGSSKQRSIRRSDSEQVDHFSGATFISQTLGLDKVFSEAVRAGKCLGTGCRNRRTPSRTA